MCIGECVDGQEYESKEPSSHRGCAGQAVCCAIDHDVLESHTRKSTEREELKRRTKALRKRET